LDYLAIFKRLVVTNLVQFESAAEVHFADWRVAVHHGRGGLCAQGCQDDKENPCNRVISLAHGCFPRGTVALYIRVWEYSIANIGDLRMDTPEPNAAPKRSKKEIVLEELREILFIVVYLAVSFSILATFRCLVLIQVGIDDFAHSYLVAGVEALALGKIVAIG